MSRDKNRRYEFTISVSFPVDDDEDFCENEDGNVCCGDCGGECERPFIDKLKKWLNNCTHDPDVEYTSSNLSREDHNDNECKFVSVTDSFGTESICSICRREKPDE